MDIVRRNSVLVIHGSLRVNPLHPTILLSINISYGTNKENMRASLASNTILNSHNLSLMLVLGMIL